MLQWTKTSETSGTPGSQGHPFYLVCKILGGEAGAGKALSEKKEIVWG